MISNDIVAKSKVSSSIQYDTILQCMLPMFTEHFIWTNALTYTLFVGTLNYTFSHTSLHRIRTLC